MVTASLMGSRVKFSYCSLEKAIAFLKEQYAVGTVEGTDFAIMNIQCKALLSFNSFTT